MPRPYDSSRPYESFDLERLKAERAGYLPKKRTWINVLQSIFFIIGLLAAFIGVTLVIADGIDWFSGAFLLVGGLGGAVIYFWRQQERLEKVRRSELDLIDSELRRRR